MLMLEPAGQFIPGMALLVAAILGVGKFYSIYGS
jgi:hypothetical protein